MENGKESEFEAAHRRSLFNRDDVRRSARCGCFRCLAVFPPGSVLTWWDLDASGVGQTAVCPHCGSDCVLGDASGYPIAPQWLQRMNAFWF